MLVNTIDLDTEYTRSEGEFEAGDAVFRLPEWTAGESEPADAPAISPSGSDASPTAAKAPGPASTPIRAGAPPALLTPKADAV